jgi:biotin carboxyl carrier protein
MKKEKFVYNPKSLTFERYSPSASLRAKRILALFILVLLCAGGLTYIQFEYMPSAKELALSREVEQMKIKYSAVNEQLGMMSKVLDNIQERDANVHRMVFGMDPIDGDIWNAGIGGHERYTELTNYKNSGELLINTLEKADKLARQITVQSRSLDELEEIASEKEKYLNAIPAIKPVRSDRLARKMTYLSGYGVRIHPIHKIPKMHYGIDFTAPKGTTVRATGDGKVVRIKRNKSGYGNSIMIDHGYAFTSFYAHLQDIGVKVGQKVKKGEQIGTIGNTGTSTAPHLHYEIRYKGNHVNPIHYCMDGLTPQEYEEMVKMASEANKSFD